MRRYSVKKALSIGLLATILVNSGWGLQDSSSQLQKREESSLQNPPADDPWVDLCSAIEVRGSHVDKFHSMLSHFSRETRKFLYVSDGDIWFASVVAKKSRLKQARRKILAIASRFGYDLCFMDGTWYRCRREKSHH